MQNIKNFRLRHYHSGLKHHSVKTWIHILSPIK